MKHKKDKGNPKKKVKSLGTENNRQSTKPNRNGSKKQNNGMKKHGKEPDRSTTSKNTSIEKNKMQLVTRSNKKTTNGSSEAVAAPRRSKPQPLSSKGPVGYSARGNSTRDVRKGSIGDLEDGLGRLSVYEGGRTFRTKKGNILEIVPRDEIERKCYCRSHKPETKPLKKASSNSSTRSDPKKELYSSLSKQDETFRAHKVTTFHESDIDLYCTIWEQVMIREKREQRQLNRPLSPQTSANPSEPITVTNKAWDNRPANENTTRSFADIMKQEKYKPKRLPLSESSCEKKYRVQPDKKVLRDPELILELWEGTIKPTTELYTLENISSYSYYSPVISHDFNRTMPSYKMTSIKQIKNPFLQIHYNLRKRFYGCHTEMLLYHGTKIENVDSICTNNFDWRLVSRHKYGWGVSFSNNPYYASHYSDESGSLKVMFAVQVVISLTQHGNCNTEVPPAPYDTTSDHAGKVYVKYDDCSFYPAYVIYYTSKEDDFD